MAIEPIEGFLCSAADLTVYIDRLLRAAGADEASAAAVARAVVDASSRGVDTHGVRLVPWYMQILEGGRIIEAGPPGDLIRDGGRFAALVELEAAGWDWRET